MSRNEFYKEYYKRTDEEFADEMIGGKESREKAWRNRQRNTSKKARILHIVLQYVVLLGCLIFFCTGMEWWRFVIPFFLLYLPLVYVTDFSLLKMELLYRIYRPNSIYAQLLHDFFLGKSAEFITDLRRATQSKVNGYVHLRGKKFYGKFRAVCKSQNEEILITFYPRKVKIKANSQTVIIRDRSLSRTDLIRQIASVVNTIDGK